MMGNQKCKTFCNNKFGYIAGINSNVPAYINCDCKHSNTGVSILSKEISGLNNDIQVGYKWQCVEYARRWLIINYGIYFESISCAYQIFDIKNVTNLKTNKYHFFKGFENKNKEPPKFGDLIIFPIGWGQPWGHVAVCTRVDLDNEYIEIAEQNDDHGRLWDDYNSHSRRLLLLKLDDGHYTLTEIPYKGIKYDKNEKEQISKKYKSQIIGWKRVLTDEEIEMVKKCC